jgi:carbon storage regulator CsrA
MWVYWRGLGESVVISDDITVRVVEIEKSKVTLEIIGPKGTLVRPKEIFDAEECLKINKGRESR